MWGGGGRVLGRRVGGGALGRREGDGAVGRVVGVGEREGGGWIGCSYIIYIVWGRDKECCCPCSGERGSPL